jgi:hypothetical protein
MGSGEQTGTDFSTNITLSDLVDLMVRLTTSLLCRFFCLFAIYSCKHHNPSVQESASRQLHTDCLFRDVCSLLALLDTRSQRLSDFEVNLPQDVLSVSHYLRMDNRRTL